MTLTLDQLAEAIDAASVGYTIRLTKLVDGEAEYTATVDGEAPRTFPDRSEASEYVDTFRRLAKARAILSKIEEAGFVVVPREATMAMLIDGAATHRDFFSQKGPYPRSKAVWSAMIQSAPKIGGK